MKQYKNLEELKAADKFIYDDICDCVFPEDVKAEFAYSLGGDVHVVETVEDLSAFNVNGVSLNDAVVPGFDSVEYVGTDREFILFLKITSDSGGNCYFVPKAVYEKQPNVEATLELFES